MPPQKVAVFGSGGTCIDILDTILCINDAPTEESYEFVGFLDDNESMHGKDVHGYPVLGPLSSAASMGADVVFVNGIGSPNTYFRKPDIIANAGVPIERFITLVHPSATVSRFATLGRGTVILQNVCVGASATIGDHVVVLPNAVVNHHCTIGSYTCIASSVSLAGGVSVAPKCYIGQSSSVRGDLNINEGALVGLGAVVLRDVEGYTVVAGSPAKVLRKVKV